MGDDMSQEIERAEHLYGTPPDEKVNPTVRSNRQNNDKRFARDLKEKLGKKKQEETATDEVVIDVDAMEEPSKDDAEYDEEHSDQRPTPDTELPPDGDPGHIDVKA
jgi:hypothetical protein